jgi:hypothetical protein
MSVLRVGPDWATQIKTLRDAVTEDTNLIRFDNGFYRICRPGPDFVVRLQPGTGGAGIELVMQSRDLYVTRIDGKPFERYASTLDGQTRDYGGLSGAVSALPGARGTELFELQSLLVFCVGESLRSDEVAIAIEQAMRASVGGLRGVSPRLPMTRLLRIARSWGQGSDAIFAAMSPEARALVLQPRASMTESQRRFSERIDLSRIDPALHDSVRAIKVLKRPA